MKNNQDKIDWKWFSLNINGIDILKQQHPKKINWKYLSANPNAIDILKNHKNRIYWNNFSANINIFKLVLNKNLINSRMNIIKEELLKKAFHPKRLQYLLNTYNCDFDY